jgi:hypothetical protein
MSATFCGTTLRDVRTAEQVDERTLVDRPREVARPSLMPAPHSKVHPSLARRRARWFGWTDYLATRSRARSP